MQRIQGFSGSYAQDDVTFLLKPVSIEVTSVEEKERLIQSGGRHYSEMLSPEKVPDGRYMDLYAAALERNAARLHADVLVLADALAQRAVAGEVVIASLARAGTPIGVLLARRLRKMGVASAHYSVSIIRDRGIDGRALEEIRRHHDPKSTVFVDGWTGKGAIAGELRRSIAHQAPDFSPGLAVIADPAGVAEIAATSDDYVIPSGLLNGIVSGLVSRSVLNDDVVGPGDYHACLFQEQHRDHDVSHDFIAAIESVVPMRRGRAWTPDAASDLNRRCRDMIAAIMDENGVTDVNRIKPGIAEATRAVLRRVPDRLYLADPDDAEVAHLAHLADTQGVPVSILPGDSGYRAVTVIKSLGSE